MKKLISMLLLVSMVLLLLSACNSLERDEETTESSTTENTDIPTQGGIVMPPNCQIEHSYDDGVITTLSEKEVILYTCRVCNDTKTVDLPKDFAFSVTWGFDGKYNSQTGHLENGYNYQLGTKCETTLILEHRELMNIYRLLYNANFTQIEEDFFASDIDVDPSYNIKFSYFVDGKTTGFTIKGASPLNSYTEWELYPEFGYAHEKIVDFITNTEEYKSLPPNTNAYD